MSERKTFLFLQGHPTFLWVRLGDQLKAAGHRVLKVRFSGMDIVYWPRRGGVFYTGRKAKWRGWIQDYMRREGVTDVLYFADRHPLHVDALDAAKAAGVRPWTIEFGYLRPDWLTLEPEAMGAFSRFPKDRESIMRLGAPDHGDEWDEGDPMKGPSIYPGRFIDEATSDIGMYASTVLFWPLFPHYRLDIPYNMFSQYYNWLRTLASEKKQVAEAERVEAECAAPGADYTFLAMQLAQDYQIRASSPYDAYEDMIDEVMESMARCAPPTRRLVLKVHPLDNGRMNWPRRIGALARKHGLSDRVDLVRGGDLGVFLKHAHGVVLANSTVGIHALRSGKPVITLGEAVFDMPGLTHQSGLDAFWTAPEPVDRELSAALLRALAREIQIKGSVFHKEGARHAVEEIAKRLTTRPYPAWAL